MATLQVNVYKDSFDVRYALTEGRYDVPDDSSATVIGYDIFRHRVSLRDHTPAPVHTTILPLGALVAKVKKERSSDALPESLRNNWQQLATSGLSDELYNRLVKLANKPDGWRGKGSRCLSAGSLRYFLRFWRLIKGHAVEPFLTLAPNGHLYAEWHASWKRHLDIEFTDNSDVFYGLFHGNKVHEGREGVSELANMLLSRSVNPLRWGD